MLTDTQCRTAKPKEKPYKLPDGKGLYLEIKPNGVKAWRYRFELHEGDVAKESIFAIGDYAIAPSGETPEEGQARRGGRRFTLAEARDERIKARALVKQGINPAHNIGWSADKSRVLLFFSALLTRSLCLCSSP